MSIPYFAEPTDTRSLTKFSSLLRREKEKPEVVKIEFTLSNGRKVSRVFDVNQTNQQLELSIKKIHADNPGEKEELEVYTKIRALEKSSTQWSCDDLDILFSSCILGNTGILSDLILTRLLDLNQLDMTGYAPLRYAARFDRPECVQLLLKANADPDIVDCEGWAPLHITAQHDHTDCMLHLVEAGATLDIRGQDGKTPLHIAAELGHANTVKLLLEANANPNIVDNEGCAPLHITARHDHTDCMLQLVESEATLNIRDQDGNTSLHIAAELGHVNIVKLWLGVTADLYLHIENNEGHTPVQLAKLNDHKDCLILLMLENEI